MTITVREQERLADKLAEIKPHLDERQWRLLLGAEARVLGRGGQKLAAHLAHASPDTVGRGVRELELGITPTANVRNKGAGRPPAEQVNPQLGPALDALVEPETRGDPQSPRELKGYFLTLGLLGLRNAMGDAADERLVLRGAVVSWIGAGLTLPYYGAEVFGLNIIAQRALDTNDPSLLVLADQFRYGTVPMVVFAAGLLLLGVGAVMASVAMWRSGTAGGWGGVLLAVRLRPVPVLHASARPDRARIADRGRDRLGRRECAAHATSGIDHMSSRASRTRKGMRIAGSSGIVRLARK